jgi:hypothetical protein
LAGGTLHLVYLINFSRYCSQARRFVIRCVKHGLAGSHFALPISRRLSRPPTGALRALTVLSNLAYLYLQTCPPSPLSLCSWPLSERERLATRRTVIEAEDRARK